MTGTRSVDRTVASTGATALRRGRTGPGPASTPGRAPSRRDAPGHGTSSRSTSGPATIDHAVPGRTPTRSPGHGAGRSRPAPVDVLAEAHAPAGPADTSAADRSTGTGIRLNGAWCAVLLLAGDALVLLLAGAAGVRPGVLLAVAAAMVAAAVALLAGRGGLFEAAVLPGTVLVVVGAVAVATDPSALGGVVAGSGGARRVWDSLGVLAPAAGVAWATALVTLLLRRLGVLRRF